MCAFSVHTPNPDSPGRPAIGRRSSVVKQRRAPVPVKPVLILSAAGEQIARRQNRTGDAMADALIVVTADGIGAARAKEQGGGNAARPPAAREHAAKFSAQYNTSR